MGETKFTHGPWEWVGDTLEVVDEPWNTVLEVEDLPRHTYSELQTGELVIQNENDRPLIAAATDLYARVADHANNCRVCNGAQAIYSACGTRSLPCPTCAEDRAALAKARGETP